MCSPGYLEVRFRDLRRELSDGPLDPVLRLDGCPCSASFPTEDESRLLREAMKERMCNATCSKKCLAAAAYATRSTNPGAGAPASATSRTSMISLRSRKTALCKNSERCFTSMCKQIGTAAGGCGLAAQASSRSNRPSSSGSNSRTSRVSTRQVVEEEEEEP